MALSQHTLVAADGSCDLSCLLLLWKQRGDVLTRYSQRNGGPAWRQMCGCRPHRWNTLHLRLPSSPPQARPWFYSAETRETSFSFTQGRGHAGFLKIHATITHQGVFEEQKTRSWSALWLSRRKLLETSVTLKRCCAVQVFSEEFTFNGHFKTTLSQKPSTNEVHLSAV